MAISLKTYYIPHTTRRKYGDFPTESIASSTSQGGGGATGGGGGSSEYMTSFQTDNISAGTWTVTGVYYLSNLADGISIKVKFNTDSDSGLTANTIDLGIGTEGETGTTFPKPIYITPGQLVTDEIKEGDELMLTYRTSLSGWVIDGSNERFVRDLWEFYDSGTIISKYNVASSGDVMAYGAEDYTGYTELSVIDRLDSTATPHSNYALSAYQGKVLNEKITDLASSAITQIKTINGQSLVGQGNIEIDTGGTEYNAGSGITIENDTISVSQSTWEMIDNKYDKTGGTINGSVIATGSISASGDVMSYGASSVVPAGMSVINNLTSTSTSDALSANMGRTLNNNKQDKLVSGTNIKTINNQSLLGSGNIDIQGGGGAEYTGGDNISITNNVISVTGTVASANTAVSANTAASATTAESASTAADSAKLGGVAASSYAQTNGTYADMTVGNSQKLGGHPDTYFAKATDIDNLENELDDKYDKTGGTVNGDVLVTGYVAATGDVMSYGASSVVPTGISVVDSVAASATSGTPHNHFALSAYQGFLLGRDKQDKLVSGTNIKTINNQSLLGSGNITIQGGGGGTEYTGGTNIGISNYVISVTGTVESAASATTAADSAKLGGTAASSYAQTNGNYQNMTVGTAENTTYASRLGNSSSFYTYNSLETALAGKLGTGATAADSNKLGGVAASSYAQTNGSYPSMTVGTAGSSTYASRLGTSGSYYDKSSLDTALNGKLSTGGTAYDSTRWGGYKIVVGSIGTDSNTIYFGF